ncbi:MAG: ABC transporter permease [Promicromonosporaceae bacterium]|nr:ABC transporter permease [Promicromonosporaceae bacterium]
MRKYLLRKLGIYALTLWVAVTINWLLPRMMPGDPIGAMVSQAAQTQNPAGIVALRGYFESLFGLDYPIWQQYLNYWAALFRGDMGISVWIFPREVSSILREALPWTLGLMLPAIILSWMIGNRLGALAARSKWLDNTILPIGYVLTATPYMWLAIMLAWLLGMQAGWFPTAGGFDFGMQPAWTWRFVGNVFLHWTLPFLSLFLVQLGGWAIGMRNLIIYELESDYSNYLDSLGASRRLIRKYAFRNALLPQVTGLALQLGTIIGGALVTEIVFNYPGLGRLILNAINNRDFFLLQGVLLFVVIGVLLANLIIDIIYVLIDPRTRTGMEAG